MFKHVVWFPSTSCALLPRSHHHLDRDMSLLGKGHGQRPLMSSSLRAVVRLVPVEVAVVIPVLEEVRLVSSNLVTSTLSPQRHWTAPTTCPTVCKGPADMGHGSHRPRHESALPLALAGCLSASPPPRSLSHEPQGCRLDAWPARHAALAGRHLDC